jgi:DNA-binding CsgD family transcriptional regulator
MMLTHDRTIDRLERLCRQATAASDLMRDAGNLLTEASDADACVLLRLDPLSAIVVDSYELHDPLERCTAFRETTFLRSRIGDFGLQAQGRERVMEISEDLVDDPFVEHVMRPFGYRGELAVNLAHEAHAFGQLYFSRQQGPFSVAGKALIESAVAPLTQAFRRLLAEETLQAGPGQAVGLILVDPSGRMTPASEHGRTLMAAFGHRAPKKLNSPLVTMAEVVARDLRGDWNRPIPSAIFVDHEHNQRYRIVAERLLGDQPQAMLVVEPVRALDSVDLLRHAGLTEREAEVALATVRGLTSARGALSLRISEHTFLSHLKSVYRKLGVGSRGELAALLLGGGN